MIMNGSRRFVEKNEGNVKRRLSELLAFLCALCAVCAFYAVCVLCSFDRCLGRSSKDAAAKAKLADLEKASWVWASQKAISDGEFACFFRKTFDLPSRPISATVLVTADNGYDLSINGSLVGADAGFDSIFWQSVEMYRVEHLLAAGRNVIAVRGENMGGPAGLILAARVELADGKAVELFTDATWRLSLDAETTWTSVDYDDSKWLPVAVLGPMGMAPWGKLSYPHPVSPQHTGRGGTGGLTEANKGFRFPAGVIFIRGRVAQSSTLGAPQSVWSIGGSRAYLENDTPAPAALGHKLYSLVPARPDGHLTLLLDAKKGLIGSPSVSYDGKTIYFAMAPEGENFFHIYRLSLDGIPLSRKPALRLSKGVGKGVKRKGIALTQLTKGAFHDFDPEPLPDGRIVFSSTRIGSREEYHGNVARSLFVMNPDGSNIRPLTYHIVGDNEPKVTANGEIAFIRCDNFMQRAKVETQVHVIRPDGSAGRVIFGANRSAIAFDRVHAAESDSRWLRSYGFGSIAPLPDGRVACISSNGAVVTSGDPSKPKPLGIPVNIFDISPIPDGRLLCTTASRGAIGVFEPDTGRLVRIYSTDTFDIHSAVYLGSRPKPPVLPSHVDSAAEDSPGKTGYLLCQNVFHTKQTAADLSRIKAVRVLEAVPFTNRPARHPYAHIGVEAVELGTAPLAPDGSFYVRVPADRALAIQLVDAEGRSVINEMSWIYVRPKETRTCIGCHEPKHNAPVNMGIMALRAPPLSLLGRGEPHRFRGNNAANGGVLNLQFDRFREAAAINLYSHSDLPPIARRSATESRATRYSEPLSLRSSLPPGRQDEVNRLCELLAGDEDDDKVSAIQRLAIFRDREAVPALLSALKDRSADVRMNAALALSCCGNRKAVDGLLEALYDPVPHVAQAAHIALENLTAHTQPFNPYLSAERKAHADAWRSWFKTNSWQKIESELVARVFASIKPAPTFAFTFVTLPARLEPAPSSYRAVWVQEAIEALGHVGSDDAKRVLRAYVSAMQDKDMLAYLAAIRALGHLRDEDAVPLLVEVLRSNIEEKPSDAPGSHEFGWLQKPVHYAAAAAEALGWIGTPAAERALIEVYAKLQPFWYYTFRSGDHSWLMGCHTSIVHYRIAEALDAIGSREVKSIVPAILLSVPIDTDRALLFENDSYETLVARIVNRAGMADEGIEACLAILGDKTASASKSKSKRIIEAVTTSPPAESVGPLGRESRAAQIASIICNNCLNPDYARRLRAAFDRYRAKSPSKERSWVCFYLARALGKLGDRESVDSLLSALDDDPTEVSFGLEAPPNVFIYKAMTPFYRAAAAYALGLIGDKRAFPSLLRTVANFDNAMDVRHAAARALEMLIRQFPPSPDDKEATNLLKQLKELAADYPEVSTRRVLLKACATLNTDYRP